MITGEPYREFLCDQSLQGWLAEPELFPESADTELAWQSRWFAGDFGRQFTTVDGRPAEIVQFGFWNRGAGPDFLDCVVRIDEVSRRGSIELDPDARDWEWHGHARNPAYDGTVLHLFLANRSSGEFFTRTSSNRLVPQVHLVPPAEPLPAGRAGSAWPGAA